MSSTVHSEAQARIESEALLRRTLYVLPNVTAFSRKYPKAPFSVGSDANAAACDDNDTEMTGPLNLGLTYWVITATPADADTLIASIGEAWKTIGWQTKKDGNRTLGHTDDDYLLIARKNKYDDVSVSISSPCFPRETERGAMMPETITNN